MGVTTLVEGIIFTESNDKTCRIIHKWDLENPDVFTRKIAILHYYNIEYWKNPEYSQKSGQME